MDFPVVPGSGHVGEVGESQVGFLTRYRISILSKY